jgi:hypothetical protein
MNMLSHGRSRAFPADADDKMWVTRDYFWAVGAGLLAANTVRNWRSFQAGFADHAAAAPAPPGMEAR